MHVIFIENEDVNRDSSGGVMSYILNLSNYYRSIGLSTKLIGSGKVTEGISNNKFDSFASILENPLNSNFKFFLKLFTAKELKSLNKSDVIHVQRAEMVIPISLRVKNKVVCTLHGGQDLAVYKKKGMLFGLFYSFLQFIAFIFVNQLIAVDSKNMDRFVKNHKWIKNKIHLIPIAINIDKYFPKDKIVSRKIFDLQTDEKIALFIGRLEQEKNVEFLINGFSEVDNLINKRLLIVGSGSLDHQLKEYAKSKSDKISFLGEIDNEAIPDIINCADVLMLTSQFEGSPTVVKEAICCNKPVISTDVGDVKEVLSQTDAGIIIEDNIESLKSAIETIFLNSDKDYSKYWNNFSHSLMGDKTLKIYSKDSK